MIAVTLNCVGQDSVVVEGAVIALLSQYICGQETVCVAHVESAHAVTMAEPVMISGARALQATVIFLSLGLASADAHKHASTKRRHAKLKMFFIAAPY